MAKAGKPGAAEPCVDSSGDDIAIIAERKDRDWIAPFLAALAETSNVTKSANKARVSASQAYRVRRDDPDFRAAWYAALCEGYEHLELEVLERLRSGDFVTADGAKFDFGAALRCLSAHKDSVAAHRTTRSGRSEQEIADSINARLDALRESELKRNPRLLDGLGFKD